MVESIHKYSYQNYNIELDINESGTLFTIIDTNNNKMYQCELNDTIYDYQKINRIKLLFKKSLNLEKNYLIWFKKSFMPVKNINIINITLIYNNDSYSYEENLFLDEIEPKAEFECTCCYGIVEIKNLIICDKGHFVCSLCYKIRANDVIFINFNHTIKCLNTNEVCNCVISETVMEKILDKKVYAQLVKNRLKNDIKNLNLEGINLYQCTNCQYYFDNNLIDNVFICPECYKAICLKCNKKPHIGKPCDFERIAIEEKLTKEALQNFLICKCSKIIEKNGGCKYITCPCGNHMCWLCKQNVNDHNHTGIQCVPKGNQ